VISELKIHSVFRALCADAPACKYPAPEQDVARETSSDPRKRRPERRRGRELFPGWRSPTKQTKRSSYNRDPNFRRKALTILRPIRLVMGKRGDL